MWRRALAIAVLTGALALAVPAAAHASAGDLYAAGTAYKASTYANHRSVFGGREQWVCDINANEGDSGRPIYAPEPGTVTIFSTGWGDGYGNSIVWTSADGREQIHVAHLSAFGATGQVAGGALIGKAGSTGNSTGDHMHVSRAYDGQPAPLVLSGQQIVPGYSGNGNQYCSAGQVPLALSISGVLDGQVYYCPVTVSYSCAGADPGSVACTIDGNPAGSGALVSAEGTHRVELRATIGGVAVARALSFAIASPPAPGLEPVFRFYNAGRGTHFFTPSHDERDRVITGLAQAYAYEGVCYWIDPADNPQPLYRFYNRKSGSHFYTASDQEAAATLASWPEVFSLDGRTFPVSPVQVPGSVTVYRFLNLENSSHFFTASEQERDAVITQWPGIYRFEGPAFWLVQQQPVHRP
ncbi:MAG: M23 family metallopeptidase [Actinobacteria bacterium]|nr:M23 family metallopeptidase [Actinomycetota bacterium]